MDIDGNKKIIVLLFETIAKNKMFDMQGYGKINIDNAMKLAEERNHICYYSFNEDNQIIFSINEHLLNKTIDSITLNNGINNLDIDDKKFIVDNYRDIQIDVFKNSMAKITELIGHKVPPPEPPPQPEKAEWFKRTFKK